MHRAPELAVGHDVVTEFVESGSRSVEAFAAELDVPVEWVEYWLALAKLKRQQHDAELCLCD